MNSTQPAGKAAHKTQPVVPLLCPRQKKKPYNSCTLDPSITLLTSYIHMLDAECIFDWIYNIYNNYEASVRYSKYLSAPGCTLSNPDKLSTLSNPATNCCPASSQWHIPHHPKNPSAPWKTFFLCLTLSSHSSALGLHAFRLQPAGSSHCKNKSSGSNWSSKSIHKAEKIY